MSAHLPRSFIFRDKNSSTDYTVSFDHKVLKWGNWHLHWVSVMTIVMLMVVMSMVILIVVMSVTVMGILWTCLHFCLVLKQAADIGEDGKGNYCGNPEQWGTPGYRHLRPSTGRTSKKQTWETGVKSGQLILVNPCDILLPWYHHRSGFSFMIIMIIMMMIIIKFLKALTSWLRWNVPLQEPAQWRVILH